MSKSLIYLIGIFALWFYFYLAEKKDERGEDGFDMKKADEAQSGRGGTATVSYRGGGFTNKKYTEYM